MLYFKTIFYSRKLCVFFVFGLKCVLQDTSSNKISDNYTKVNLPDGTTYSLSLNSFSVKLLNEMNAKH